MSPPQIYCQWLAGREWVDARLRDFRRIPRDHAGLTSAWKQNGDWYCSYCGAKVRVIQ